MAKVINQTTINRTARIVARESRELQRFAARLDSRYEKSPVVQSAVTAGRNQVQIGGNLYPAEGVEGQGGAVAVVNMGTAAVAKYAPANRRSVVGVAGSGLGSGGGGGGGGPVYLPGDAIDINGSNVISVKLDAAGAIVLSGTGRLKNNVGDGMQIQSNALTLNLATNPALEYVVESGANKVRVKTGNGLTRDATGVIVNLATNPGLEFGTSGDAGKLKVKPYHGLERTANGVGAKLLSGMTAMVVDANGLAIADAIAGAGLSINGTTKVLSVNTGDGIDIVSDAVAVDVTDIINTAFGLYEPTANDIGINVVGNTGLLFLGSGALALGAPSTLSVTSINHVTSTTHGHAITSSSDVGTTPAQAILASTAGGALTLAQLTLRGNLIFAGGDRSITASNNLTIAPTTDLILDPTGLILLGAGSGQELRTPTFNDFVAGIAGLRHWDTGGNVRQLTIGKIKADELFVRFFTADEVRVNRGEEFWSRSYGIVETEFTVPADEATVDVWFEEAPDIGSGKLFLPDNWLLVRQIDISTSLTVQAIWFQVVDAGANDYITRQDASGGTLARQQWRLRRKSGGVTGTLIRKGNVIVDFGKPFSVTTPSPGQGVVHLSALSQDGGPYVAIQTFESVLSDVPQFKRRVQMGNLTGTVDYASDIFGFAAGDDLSLTPSTGFSGATVDQTNGMRLFNTELRLYEGSTQVINLAQATGLRFLLDTAEGASAPRYLSWSVDLNLPYSNNNESSIFGAYTNSGVTTHSWRMIRGDASNAAMGRPNINILILDTKTGSSDPGYNQLIMSASGIRFVGSTGTPTTYAKFLNSGKLSVGFGLDNPVSTGHFYENSSSTDTTAGVTVEQAGTGDAVVQFLLTGGQRWVIGIDNSDNDKFKIASGVDLNTNPRFTIDGSNVGINSSSPATLLDVRGSGAIRHLQSGSNGGIFFQNIVDAGNSFSRVSVAHNAVWNFSTDLWEIDAIGANDAQAFIIENGGHMAWVIHTSTGNTARTMDHATFMGGKRMRLYNTGALAVLTDMVVGTDSFNPVSRFWVYENTSNTGTTAGVTIEQDGTGDAVVQFLLTGGQRWVAGIDNSASDMMRLSPSADVGSSPVLSITTGGLFGFSDATAFTPVYAIDVRHSAAGLVHITESYSDQGMYMGSGSASQFFIGGGVSRAPGGIYTARATTAQIIDGSAGSIEFRIDSGLTVGATYIPDTVVSIVGGNGNMRVGQNAQDINDGQLVIGSVDVYGLIIDANLNDVSTANLMGQYSRGSHTSPAAVQNNDGLLVLSGRGYAGATATYPSSPPVVIRMIATETHSNTARGTSILFEVTPNGSTTRSPSMQLVGDGNVLMPVVYTATVGGTNADLFIDNTGKLGKAPSSLRYKTNITPLEGNFVEDFLMRLNPVRFNYISDPQVPQIGLIAEEVEQLGLKELIVYNQAGQVESIQYSRFIVPLIIALQQVTRRLKELEMRLN